MAKVHDNATDLVTFARSSSGTALRRVGYGENLVDNGDFATTDISAWGSFDGTLAVVGGQLELTYTTATQYVWVEVTTTPGTLYEFSIDCRSDNAVGHKLVAWSEAFPLGTQIAPNPSFVNFSASLTTQTLGVRATTSTTLFMVSTQLTSGTAYFDNVSVKEVIFDRATDPLVLFNHPDDTPRIEYGSDGSLKGLLIEEQRTNLILDSNDPTTVNWSTQTTTASQSLTGPDGAANSAWTLEDADSGGFKNNRVILTVPAAAATYTTSFYVLKDSDETRFPEFQMQLSGGSSVRHFIRINTATGATSAPQNNGGSYRNVEDCGDWWRISFDITNDGTNTTLSLKIFPAGSLNLVGGSSATATGSIGFYGAQLEQGSFATSYIPTSGSQQTRSADVASIPVSAFGYNQQAGTVVVEALAPVGDNDNRLAILVDAGTVNNRVVDLYRQGTGIRMYNGYTVLSPGDPNNAAEGFTTAGAYSAGDYAAGVDGGSLATASNASVNDPDTLFIGSNGLSQRQLNGHIKSLKYYPRRLTDAQLQELTA